MLVCIHLYTIHIAIYIQHACTYTYVHMYLCMCVYIYIYIYSCFYVYIYVYTYYLGVSGLFATKTNTETLNGTSLGATVCCSSPPCPNSYIQTCTVQQDNPHYTISLHKQSSSPLVLLMRIILRIIIIAIT